MRRQPSLPARRSSLWPRRWKLAFETFEERTQPATLTLTLANPSLVENGASTTATVVRTGDLSQPLVVAVANGDTSEAAAPSTVTIAAGSATADFTVSPVDDALADGTQSVTLTGTAVTGPLGVRPDPTFGSAGYVNTPAITGGSSTKPGAVLLLPDGKIVAAASTAAGMNGWAVYLLNPDGSVIVTSYTAFPGATEPGTAYAIARQADGKILIAGDSTTNGVTDWAVARYNADGTSDFTFGNSGTLVLPHVGYDSIYDMQVEADGNILVSGFWYDTSDFRVTRISPAGVELASASIPVYQAAPGERVYSLVNDMAIGADGKIALVGVVDVQNSSTGAQIDRFSTVVRLNPDLSPDSTFGSGGFRTFTAAQFGSYAEVDLSGVEVLADGRVVVGGTAWQGANHSIGHFATARFNTDGTLDTSYAGDGTATLSLAGGNIDNAEVFDLAVQPNGKVVLAGYAWRSGNGTNQALARFNSDGTADTSFNTTGYYVAADYPAQGSFEQINAIDLLPDGRLVAQAGGTTPVTNGTTTTMESRQWVVQFEMATGESLTAAASLTVADDEPPDPALTLSVSPATFSEAAGTNAAIGTVTRANVSLAAAQVVTLVSSDTTEATVPATVTIPAGQASVSFAIAAVNDTVGDGSQAVTITASAAGLTGTAAVTVTDDDPALPGLEVRINKPSVLEQTGSAAATGTVTRYNLPLSQAQVVTLSSSDTTEATVPTSVTIPAGQASATFAIASVDDTFTDGSQAVTITASTTGPGLTGPISYDTSWGNSGWVNGFVNGQVAIAPDGKMVVAGTVGTAGQSADFGIYRYNANGTADSSFGPQSNGYVQLNPVGPSDQPSAVLVQSDGKVIVAGFGVSSTTGTPEVVVVRLRTNGTLDGFEFGTGGVVRISAFGGSTGSVSDAALQPDGKILLSGTVGGSFAVMRLNANGTLDTSFNGTGWATTALSSATGNRAYGVAVAPDGKIVAVGVTGQGSAATSRLAVVRYNADGTPDTSFGPNGVRETDVLGTSFSETATDVVVQPDGKVVVAATLGNSANGSNDFAALRYKTDGTLDTGFGSGGLVTEAAASAYGGTTRVILQTDGRIVLAGTAGQYTNSTIRGRFVRLSSTGAFENRADSAWVTSTTQSVAQDSVGNFYLAYNYGSSGSSGYVDRYKSTGATIAGTAGLSVLDNEPFAALADTYSVTEETALTVSAANGVRVNDTVTTPISVTAELVAGPAHGILNFNSDGSFTYTPATNFSGADGFTYRLRDGIGVTNTATVTVNVTNVNDAPVAVNDSYSTAEDTTLTVSAVVGQTSLSMVSDAGDYIGQGQTYNLSPPSGNFTATGNATYLTINYQNTNTSSDYWTLQFRSPFDNVPLTPGTYLNAERAAFRTVGKPGLDVTGRGRGSNTLTGQFTILQIETNASGQITRFAADFEQHSEGATPALRGSIRFNYAPGAGPGVLANDSDVDHDPLTVALITGPSHGQVGLNPNGTFSYTPDANYNGSDSFQYQVSDGQLQSNTATVNITITAVNDPPVTVNDSATTPEDTAATINVLANDFDVEGATLKPTIVTTPAHGTVSVNNANQVIYTPAANFYGTDSFTYKATEISTNVSGNVATVTVTVTPVQDAPIAGNNSYTTDQGVTLTVGAPGVLYNDSDPDGDALTAALAAGPNHGVVTLNPDGSLTYVPDPAFFGTDSFAYAADDGHGNQTLATVTLTVLRTNDPPVAVDDAATTNEDTQVGIGAIANDSDPNGDPIMAVVYTQPAHGSAAYSANDGRIYYMPAANFNGTDTFTYRAYDGRAFSAPATVTVTVNPVNDAPIARNDSYDTQEDTPKSVGTQGGLLANDTDAESDPITAVLVSGPSHGTLTFDSNGSFSYSPALNYNGVDTFTYQATDGQAFSAVATVSITVTAVNDPPVGVDDTLPATEDTNLAVLTSMLVGNDTDPDGNNLSIGSFTQPAHGTLTAAVSFSGLIYRASPNYNGPDSFTYRPFDGQLQGNVTTVTINVAAVNDAPVATPDSYTLAEDTTVTVPAAGVLINDSDVEGDSLTAGLVAGPVNGTLNLNPDGGFTYTPRANYFGTDSFTYRPSDGTAQGNTVTVSLTITAVNDAPVAVDDTYTVAEDGTLTIAAGGTTLDQQSLGEGYTFNAGITGVEWQQGVKAGTAGVLASIDLFIYSGSATGASFDVYVNKGAPWQADSPEFVTRLTVTSAMVNNWVTIDTSAANITLNAGDDFTIGTRNGAGTSAFLLGAQDTYNTNYPAGRIWYNGAAYPTGAAGTYDLKFRTRMRTAGGVLANDTDADGNTLSVALLSGPAHGSLNLNPNGGFTYVPVADYNGPDSFSYKANDGTVDSNVATVSLDVTAVNDPPTLAAVGDLTIAEDAGAQTVGLSGITAGPANEAQTLTVTATSSNTGLIPNPTVDYTSPSATGILAFTPVANASGTATITVTVSDGSLTATRQFTVTVNAVNDTPTAGNDSATTNEDTAVAVAVLTNDGDIDGDPLAVTAVTQGAHGAVTFTAAGVTYTPAANFNGSDSFTYTISDGNGGSATGTVVISVTAVNDPPVAANDSATANEDTAVAVAVLANDSDAENDPLTVTGITQPAHGSATFTATGVTYTPAANFNGSDSFTYTISDGNGGSATGTVAITVNSVNDLPTASNDSATTNEDTPVTVAVLANDTDIDGDPLAVTAVTQPAHGTATFTASGVTYTPAANFNGSDSFTYSISDGNGGTGTGTVSIAVTPVNDPPVAVNDSATTNEDTAVTVAVRANDTDAENNPLTVTAVTQPAHGTTTFTATGVTYTPAANYFGSDTFTYSISDGNGGSATGTVAITVTSVNDAPTLSTIANMSILEDAGNQTVNLSGISAGPNESQTLTVTATSSNTSLIPNPTVGYTSPNATGTLSFAPVANANGTATITVTVSDGSLAAVRQFTVTVTAVNDAPTTTGLAPVTMLEDAAQTNVLLTTGFADIEDGAAGLTYTVVGNTNAALFSSVSVSAGTLRLTPAANANGSATLTIRATDTGGLTVQTTLAVTVTPVNDAPSFTAGANQSVTAGTGPKSVTGWASNISRGPSNESSQTLTFVATTTNPGLFVAPPAIDSTGTLTFIPEASATGTATVTVVLNDNGGTANGGIDTSTTRTFTITVNSNGLPTTVGVRIVGTELVITGANTADTVTVSPQGNKVKVVATLNGSNFNQTFSNVTRVRVDTKGGNDSITFASDLQDPTWTDAGVGNDTVTGSGQVDEIYLGDGDDSADGGAGSDFIAGGTGEDLIQGGAGNDALYGGDGDDFAIGGTGIDQLFGQVGNDILVGGSAAVRNSSSDSLRKVLTEWNPASTGVGGHTDLRNRLQITDDGAADRFVGSVGIDWFWEPLSVPIDDLEAGEQRN
jgi:large repetitive protein